MNKYLILLFLNFLVQIFAQEEVFNLPQGFRNITIGLTMEEAKEEIENDGYFNYRGDPDVSMLLSEDRSIIECDGYSYIRNGFFQFYNEILYTITLVLNTEKVDYHSIFNSLVSKYGKYKSLTPKVVTWEDDNIRITLEKPLTIKYIGLNTYNNIVAEDKTDKAIEEKLREEFINEF